jgi:hypothetical protein
MVIPGLPFSHHADTSMATLERAEPEPSCAQGYSFDRSAWYAYTPAQAGSVTAHVETWFSTALAVYTGSSIRRLTQVDSRCWGDWLTFRVEAGTTYYFQIGGMYGDGGSLILYLEGPPENDDFANAVQISAIPFNHYVDTTRAGLEAAEPTPSCAQGYSFDKTVWYAYTPAQAGSFAAHVEAWFTTALAVYTGSSLDQLTQIDSRCWGDWLTFQAEAGTTYYFQIGGRYGDGGSLTLYLEGPPENDNFANAVQVSGIPFDHYTDTRAASLEATEPTPSCAQGYSFDKTVWYAYTPAESGSVAAHVDAWFSSALALYTGSSLNQLTQIDSRCWGDWLTFQAEAGTTYYFQIGGIWGDADPMWFYLQVTPPPEANFGFDPYEPSVFDTVWYHNWSNDPANVGIESVLWDFGDGTTSTEWSANHQYAVDGDYTVQLTVTTYDGRTASTTRDLQVRTHDVAISKFTVPNSAKAGQTRTIVVGLSSRRYPEQVEVRLYRSVPGSYNQYEWVGSLTQQVPVRPTNRTTDFKFSYTFTSEEASVGKVTFRAEAHLWDARDAFPADNEAISLATKVSP